MEVPQGFGIEGNTSINDAKRELFEEIGATDVHLNYIGQTGKDYITYLFQADLPKTFMPSFSEAEDTESITSFQLYSKNTLIKSNFTELNIFDPVTQICLLKFTQ